LRDAHRRTQRRELLGADRGYRPISKDYKKVAIIGDKEGPKWNAVEFRTLPWFTAIPGGFGVEETK
jgi:hypothetical protein